MTRRPNTRIDSSVDISAHYRTVEALTQPLSVVDWFGSPGPLEVEVGSGKGLFLETQTQQHPDRFFVGNELAFGYARLAAFRMAKARVTNGIMVQGDGLKLFREWIPDETLDAVHVYFPDPWWKERHRKRRVMQPGFIADIQRTLKPGGRLHFWTDVEEYYETTCELLAEHSQLSGPVFVPEPPAEHDRDYRTHFERRMRRNDHPVFRSYFDKPTGRPAEPVKH
jgi:tRNA (guanine-N7-)-methyltransferase